MSGPPVVTTVDAVVPPEKEAELVAGFAALSPREGLVRSELLRGQEGRWRISTTWRDLDELRAQRAAGTPPAALQLLDRLGVQHTHAVFTVERSQVGEPSSA